MRFVLRFLLACAAPAALAAQNPPANADVGRADTVRGLTGTDTSAFRRLELPTPNLIRTGSGAPGRAYWQQRADYVIHASLDTVKRVVTGDERLTYANNSPDTLRYLWLQLDQNLFRDTSRGARLFPPGARNGTHGANGGVTLTRVALAPAPARKGARAVAPTSLDYLVNGTMMRVNLPRPLPPGATLTLDLAWSFPFGPNDNRMGLEEIDGGTIYEVAQWYPRMAVYDDVRGWNTEQYLGQGEFYLEYGRFDVTLTVPANMLVAATGTLRNPELVLTATQRARLAEARKSDETVVIRGVDEVNDPASRPVAPGGTLTWHFTADSVRDFSWAAARHFVWDAASANDGATLAESFYPPSADSIWKGATQDVKFAVENYSRWMKYPYPVAINVNGIEGGMEYPMIVFCHNRTNAQALFGVTDHEIGHSWFPMIVGSNERRYAWMDEGFNTFQNFYNWEKRYPNQPNRRGNFDSYLRYAATAERQPLMTPADRIDLRTLGEVGYNKPGLALRLLRDVVLGPDRFDTAMREYVRRWAFKHPTPADFFRTMEDGAGEDLSWFWRPWFYTTATLDQSVDSIATAPDSTGKTTSRVMLRNRGGIVMPVRLDLLLEDGTTERVDLPVEIWYDGGSFVYDVPQGRRVTAAVVDPDNQLPDIVRANNRWPRTADEREPLSTDSTGKQ